jgi:hypothetical protein
MFASFDLEARPFEDRVTKHFLKYSSNPKIFCLVCELTVNSQSRFHSMFCVALERGDFLVAEYAKFNKNPEFLQRVRKTIRRQLIDKNSADKKFLGYLGILVALYGEPCDLDAGLEISRYQFLESFLQNFERFQFELSADQRFKIRAYLLKFDAETAPQVNLLLSFVLRYDRDNVTENIIDLAADKSRAYFHFGCYLESLIYTKTPIYRQDISQYLSDARLKTYKKRLMEVWILLADDAKRALLDSDPSFNLVAVEPNDPKFVQAAQFLFKREVALGAFNRSLIIEEACVAKCQLSAHWFFVDDFEQEIETAGYLGMLDLSLYELAGGSKPQIRE